MIRSYGYPRGLVGTAPGRVADIPRLKVIAIGRTMSAASQGHLPTRKGSGPDRSMADFFWCMVAAQCGWTIEEVAHKLLEVSARA